MKLHSLLNYIVFLQVLTGCHINQKSEKSSLASPMIGSTPFKAQPVQYVVPPKHCPLGKILFPNASLVNAQIQTKKPIITTVNSENLVLEQPPDPYETWLDGVVQEMSKKSEVAISRAEVLQAYRRFLANGDCPEGSEWCVIAAKHLSLGNSAHIASDEIDAMLSKRYGAFLDKKEDEAFRKRLFLSLGNPVELQGKNRKSYQAVLDYEKWVWKYHTPTPDDWLITNRMYYSVALSRSLYQGEKLGDWVKFNERIKKYFDFVTPELFKKYENFKRSTLGRDFNTSLKPFILGHEVDNFYKFFDPNKNLRAKSVRGYLETWLENKDDKTKKHLFKEYDKSLGQIENELKVFLKSVPNYKGDLWLPMIRGDRQFANKLMLNIAEISEKEGGKFQLSELLPGLQPGRLIVGDLDSLVASEGTAFNHPPRDWFAPLRPQTYPPNRFYGVLVRIKSPEIKVTYPLHQPQSGFWEFNNVRNASTTADYGSYDMPYYSFPGFVEDRPDSYYQIERIEKINPNLTILDKSDPEYNTFKALNFDILITIVKS